MSGFVSFSTSDQRYFNVIAYEKNLWQFSGGKDIASGNFLHGTIKLTTDLDPYKYTFCGYISRLGLAKMP